MFNKTMKKAQKISILLIITLMTFGLWSPRANAALSITTNNASNVGYDRAILSGMLSEGSLPINAWFEFGTNPNSFNLATSPTYYNSLSSNFTAPISGLSSTTTYYFRAIAENSQGRVYGNILSFTTSYNPNYYTNNINPNYIGAQPAITTNPATVISGNSAILNGFVNGNGLSTTAWFEWDTNTNFTNSTSQNYYGESMNSFNITLNNLYPNTLYYFRTVAQNPKGRVFGNTMSFVTGPMSYTNYSNNQFLSSDLRVNTNPATNIDNTSAQLNGLIVNSGTIPSDTYFEWGTTNSLGNKTEVISTGSLPAVRHANTINGLKSNTTYYFRAVANNGLVVKYGETNYFTTDNTNTVNTNITNTTNTTKNTPTITPVSQDERINIGASVIGSSFLPNNLFGWLLLFILILLVIVLAQRLFRPSPLRQEQVITQH